MVSSFLVHCVVMLQSKSLITQSRIVITSRVDESHYEKITTLQKMWY